MLANITSPWAHEAIFGREKCFPVILLKKATARDFVTGQCLPPGKQVSQLSVRTHLRARPGAHEAPGDNQLVICYGLACK